MTVRWLVPWVGALVAVYALGAAWGRVEWWWLPAVVAVAAAVRWLPVAAAGIAVVVAVLDAAGLHDSALLPAVVLACHLSGRRHPRAGLGLAAGLAVALVAGVDSEWTWSLMLLTSLPTAVFPLLLGAARTRHLAAAERRWAGEQDRITARERTRIARDMHDSLGHDLALVALRAGALELASELPERHRAELTALREAAGDATERLREIVDLLHTGSVEDLVAASGMPVDLAVTGAAPSGGPVSEVVYRVVQEGLTNAAKHAPGAAVTVRVAHGEGETRVRVFSAAPGARRAAGNGAEDNGPRSSGAAGGGHGLAGLRERARLVGGVVTAGPAAGGFEVVGWVPHRGVVEVGLGRVDRELGRGRWAVVVRPAAVTAGLAVGLAVVALGLSVVQSARAVMAPEEFAVLRVGQARAEVVLPAAEATERRRPAEPPVPVGAQCRYYRSSAVPFGEYDVYRVCFAGDRVVGKDVLR